MLSGFEGEIGPVNLTFYEWRFLMRGIPVPTFLRQQRIFYVTEIGDEAAQWARIIPPKRRVSPTTLSPLRPYVPEDYTDYTTALETVRDHPHWFGGFGIRVLPPLVAVILRYCCQGSG